MTVYAIDWPQVLPQLVAVFVVAIFGACVAVFVLVGRKRLDRKEQLEQGRGDPPWIGIGARSVAVLSTLSRDAALVLSRRVIENLGGRDIHCVDSTVTGWTGSMWTNFADWQAYQLSIVVRDEGAGALQFLCCARPRKAWTLWGPLALNSRVSKEKAEDLADEVRRLAGVEAISGSE